LRQFAEMLTFDCFFRQVISIFPNAIKRNAKSIAQRFVADIPVPPPVMPRHTQSQMIYDLYLLFLTVGGRS